MAYQYPLNGGRINASVGGNSTSAGAGYQLVSTGTLTLAGGNNITLSQNGPAITISGANIPSQTAYQFSNSNGVSFGTNGSTITATVATNYAASNHSHGNPTLNLTNLSGTTASASNGLTLSLSAPAVSSLSQTGIISLSQNGNTISIGAPAFSAGIASNSIVTNQVIFSAGNNISLSQSTNTNGATIAIHGTSGGGGIALANSQTTYSSGTANILEGSGAITIGSDTGQRFNISVPQASSISATGAVSISTNGNTISIGAPAQSVQTQGLQTINLGGNTAGAMASISSGALSLYGGDNITLSQNANSVTISGGAGGGGGGVAIAGPSGNTFTSGTVNFGANNTGAITVASTTGQQLNFAVPATSMLSAGAGINISTNGSTVVFQAATATNTTSGVVARWEYPNQGFNIINAIATNSASVQHIQVPYSVSGSAIRLAVSLNASSMTTSGTTATIGLSMLVGISTLNGSTLSSIASGSNTTSFSYSSGNYITSLYNGVREMTAPLAVTLTPGEYWVGAIIKSTQTSASATMSAMGLGLSNINTSGSIGAFGSAISAYARDVYMGQGMYGTTTTGMPTSIAVSSINNTAAGNLHRAAFYHAIYNATY